MAEKKLRTGRIAIDYLHDMSAGLFPGAVVAAWLVRGAIESVDPGRGAVVRQASGNLWFVLALALGTLVLTGVLRLRHWRLNVREGYLETKRQMAVMKHIAFVATQLLAMWALASL